MSDSISGSVLLIAAGIFIGIILTRWLQAVSLRYPGFQSSQQFAARITEASPDLIFIYDLVDQRNIYANSALTQILGFTPHEVQKMGEQLIPSLMHPDALLQENERLRQMRNAKDGEIYASEYRMRHRDQSWRWVYNRFIVFKRDPDGSVRQVLGVVTDITALKTVQEQLRTVSTQLQTVLDSASEAAIIMADADSILRVFNKGAERMLGYTADEVIGRMTTYDLHLASELVERRSAIVKQQGRQIFTGSLFTDLTPEGGPLFREWTFVRKDGSHVPVDLIVTRMQATDGQADTMDMGYVGIAIDISRRVQAEAAIREQSHLTEALHSTIIAMTSTLNLDDVMARLLESIEPVVPHDAASILLIENAMARVAYSRNYPPEIAATLKEVAFSIELPKFRQINATGRPHLVLNTRNDPYWIPTPESAWIQSHISAPIMVREKMFGILSVDSTTPNFFNTVYAERLLIFARQAAIAIENAQLYQESQQRAAELEQHVAERTAELQRRQMQLSTILDALGEGVFYSEGFIIHYANRALVELTGYPADELVERPDGIVKMAAHSSIDLSQMQEQVTLLFAAQLQASWRSEVRLVRKDGTAYDAALTVSAVRNANGQAVGSVTVARDITQEKQLESQKSAFIANASHELRTPLTSLKTRLYLMQRQPQHQSEHLTAAEKAASRMMLLLEDLLDTTRFERGILTLDLQSIVLQDLLKEIVQSNHMEADLKQIVLDLNVCEPAIKVSADANRLTQVIVNLLINAINYTPEGGHIAVTLSAIHSAGHDQALIQIADSGIGIAPEHLPHIFEPFYRANEGTTRGTGLGLSIARSIIDLHGGSLEVQSIVGKGSTFSIRLALENS